MVVLLVDLRVGHVLLGLFCRVDPRQECFEEMYARARGAVCPDREKIDRGVVVCVRRSTAQEASQKGAWYHMCMWHGPEVPSARGTKELAPLFGTKCP